MKLTKCRIGDYIKDVASGPFGSNLKVECFVPSGFPIIDGANLTKLRVTDNITKFVTEGKARTLSRSIARRRDVIVTISGTLGQISFIPDDSKYEEYLCSQRQFRVTFDESRISVEYLVNLLRTPYGQRKILAFANYVGVPALAQPIPNFKSIEVLLPDLPTQLRIAGILGSLDEKIEINRRKIAELEALAKTIYDYWFVQFDFPDANGRPYKSSGGEMKWKKELKREIPVGWRIGTIDDLGEIVSGGTPSTHNPDYWAANGIAWITPKDLSNTANKYIRHGENDITDVGLRDSSAQLMPRKSIILSTRAPIGYLAIADCDLCTNQGIKSIIPNKGFGSEFIFYTVLSLIPYIKTFGGGSTFAEISKTEYSSLQVVLPKQDIIDDFTEKITPIAEARRISEIAIEETIQLRDTLLPLLMNGQVNVAD